jgi:hypothetical protein
MSAVQGLKIAVKYVHKVFVILGRINLVELVKLLGVDLNQIAARAAEIERTDQNCSLVLGQLIDKTYVTRIAEEINEKLLQQGQITIGELTRHYDLPSDFLQTVSTIRILYLYVFSVYDVSLSLHLPLYSPFIRSVTFSCSFHTLSSVLYRLSETFILSFPSRFLRSYRM